MGGEPFWPWSHYAKDCGELRPVRTVAPAADLIDLALVKQHLRVDSGDEDTRIQALIAAVTAYLDGYSGILGRALINQTWTQSRRDFYDKMYLPVGDLSSFGSVKYYDGNNVQQTLSSSVYSVLTDAMGPYVTLNALQNWPGTIYDRDDAVLLTWTAGYGATAASVPEAIKQAALLMIGDLFENREAQVVAAMLSRNRTLDALLYPFMRKPYR